MNRLDKLTWKNCLVSTFICLVCCSIGTMGITVYLVNYSWLFVLLVSTGVGLSSSIILMTFWHMLFQQINFRDSLNSSMKMSVVSMLIMILTEDIIILFIAPKFSSHQMNLDMPTHISDNFNTMAIAMLFGFLFALPYNYYHIQKTGEICH